MLFLPSYTPQLNVEEHIFYILKSKVVKFRKYTVFDVETALRLLCERMM